MKWSKTAHKNLAALKHYFTLSSTVQRTHKNKNFTNPPFVIQWLPRWLSGKDLARQCRRHRRHRFSPWVGKIPWRRTIEKLDHRESKGIPEKHLLLLHWLHESLCVKHNKLCKILKDMGISNHITSLLRNLYVGQEATELDNWLVQNWERTKTRLYIVILLI